MNSVEEIFKEEFQSRSFAKNAVEKLEEDVLQEFTKQEDQQERTLTRGELVEKKRELQKKLARCKNVKNHKARVANAAVAETRKKLRQQIAEIDVDLETLRIEQEGFKKRMGELAGDED